MKVSAPAAKRLHERFKGHEIGISLRGDYAGVARALGAYGERVEQAAPTCSRRWAARWRIQARQLLEIAVKPLEPRPWR